MSKKVTVEKALAYHPFTPDRKPGSSSKTPSSPPDTTSKPEDIMEVVLPTPDAKKMAWESSAEDRKPRGGRKSRRRPTKKVRKTRRKSRK
jgi:hypothetical protein